MPDRGSTAAADGDGAADLALRGLGPIGSAPW